MRPGRATAYGAGDLELFEFRETTKARLNRLFYISVLTLYEAYIVSKRLRNGKEGRYYRYRRKSEFHRL
jgi:hypothetical protein